MLPIKESGVLLKKICLLWLFTIISSCLYAAPVIYQAEAGVLNGTNISASIAGYQGTGYVTGFDAAGDYCEVTVNVPTAGMYTITFGYASVYTDKVNNLYANGVYQSSVNFPLSAVFTQTSGGMVPLNAGNNTIRLLRDWGWIELDWVGVEAAVLPVLSVSDSLVNTNSSSATQCLMTYLVSNYGNHIISGQAGGPDSMWINTATAHYPALQGFDMMDYSPSRVAFGAPDPLQVEAAIAWAQAGGIVQFQWHWNAPSGLLNTQDHEWWRGFYTHATTFDVAYAMSNTSSQQYLDILRDIDAIAVQLKRLQAAGVPVLWRPLHEAQGAWFWWGAQGAAACKQLYWLVYDRIVNYHGINNLIWVWTTQDNSEAANWYPGHSYVDAVGADIYLNGGNYSPSTGMFYNIVNLVSGQKLVAMTENGTIPDAAAMTTQAAYWSWFMTWNGFENNNSQNSLAHVQSVYNNSYVLSRNDISALYPCLTPATPTATLTRTYTLTPTWTKTSTITQTHTVTRTFTVTPTFTPMNTPAPDTDEFIIHTVLLYPNPAGKGTDTVKLGMTFNRMPSAVSVSFYSHGLRLIKKIEIPSVDISLYSVLSFPVAGLANGMYFYNIEAVDKISRATRQRQGHFFIIK